jgi:hypothetical protein
MNRWTLTLAVLLLGACGSGHVAGSQAPEPVYPGSGDFDADGTPDVGDRCPRDWGSPDVGGCARPDPPSTPP